MRKFNLPILHLYAVGFGERMFPNEIYLSRGDGESEGWLVNPNGLDELNECFEEYIKLHDINYNHFVEFGKSPKIWCKELNKYFSDKEVFVSDEILETTKLQLDKLYAVAKMPSYNFQIVSLQKYLQNELQNPFCFKLLEEKAGKFTVEKLGGVFYFNYLIRLANFVLEELTKKM